MALCTVTWCFHMSHDEVIKWKHFSRFWPFVRANNRSALNSPRKGQWRGALMFSLICAWINAWVNNCEAGDLTCHCTHYGIIIMTFYLTFAFDWFDTLIWNLLFSNQKKNGLLQYIFIYVKGIIHHTDIRICPINVNTVFLHFVLWQL